MRTFKQYAPRQIAKHVAAFFKGQFVLEDKGTFVFDGGKVIIDENSSLAQREVGKEVNKLIADFLASSRTRAVESYS